MKKITSTEEIKINSVLRLYKKGYGYTKLKVIDINEYFLAAISDDDFIKKVKDTERLNAYLWLENEASYVFKLEVIGKINVGMKIIFFGHTDKLKMSNKRKCLSAEVDIPFKFFTLDVGEKNKNFSKKGINFLQGKLVELSDREAVLQFPSNLRSGTFLKGHLLFKNYMIDVVGKIVQKKEKHQKKLYNLDFTGTLDKERDKILDYVFSIYRE